MSSSHHPFPSDQPFVVALFCLSPDNVPETMGLDAYQAAIQTFVETAIPAL